MNKKKRLIIVIFLGMFGVHKFMDHDYKMGILYLLTFGIFGIGWIIDICKAVSSLLNSRSLMSKETLNVIDAGILPTIVIQNLNLKPNEVCHYVDNGYTVQVQTITTGYTSHNSGSAFRLTDRTSIMSGNTEIKANRKTITNSYTGTLYLTNQRVIYSSMKNSFEKPFDKITSIQERTDGIMIQCGSTVYSILLDSHDAFVKVFNLIKNQ